MNSWFFLHCTPTHITDSMTCPHTTSHISLEILSVSRHSHNNMVRSAEERFAMERMATRGFGSKKIAAALGVPVSTTQRWPQRLRSDGDMSSRNIGRPRGAEAGLCVWCSLHVSSHISRRVICVSRLWVHGCNEERVRAAALINAWISVDPGCTVASFANVCRRLASSAAAAASMSTWRRSTGQRSR